MALISQIQDTNNTVYNLRDDIHTWGGRNLALATNYDQFGIDTYDGNNTGITFLGNNKVKIAAGNRFYRYANTIVNFPNGPRLFKGTMIASIYVYENTLDQQSSFTYWCKLSETSGGGQMTYIPSQYTGLVQNITSTNQSFYGFSLDIKTLDATSGYLVIGPLKVEMGNKPTDWSPAPEDIAHVNGTQLILLS